MGLFFGPTNVNIWQIGIEVDGGDPAYAANIARGTNPATIAAGFRQVFFYADAGRPYARLRGRYREAIRYLLTAERLAPQHVHTSPMAQETAPRSRFAPPPPRKTCPTHRLPGNRRLSSMCAASTISTPP